MSDTGFYLLPTNKLYNSRLEICFVNIQNVNKLKFEEDWVELKPKDCSLRQYSPKYLEQKRELN